MMLFPESLRALARTLKVLDLTVSLYYIRNPVFLGGIFEELEALVGRNVLEALSLKVRLNGYEREDLSSKKWRGYWSNLGGLR